MLKLLKQKIKYLVLPSEIEKKFSDHNHDKYITTSELNKL